MRKKLVIYSIYIIVAGAIGYYLIVQYGHDVQDILQRIDTYNRYIAYTGASIVLGATMRPEKTIQSRAIIGFLSIIHIISLSKIIIHDQYGAQIYMFVISALSIVGLYAVLRIPKARIRSILTIPTLAISMLSIMIATSPFHEDISGRDDFYNQQKNKLHIYINEPMLVIQEAQANISIKNRINDSVEQNIPITQTIQTNVDLPMNVEIQFTSSIPLSNSALFVQSPRGDIYDIYSQSATIVRIGGSGLIVETTGILYTGLLSQSLVEYKSNLVQNYGQQKANYVESKIKNKLRNNIYVQYVLGSKILSYIGDKIEYMANYKHNFEKRQNMRLEAGLSTSQNISGTNLSMLNMSLIRSTRENLTNPQ